MNKDINATQTALVSMTALIIVIGFGRFALTPQIPHMIKEGEINLTQASLVAGANFLGYLLGAIDTMRARKGMIWRLKAGLCGSVLILLISALTPHNETAFAMNLLLRFAAGIASAWTLVLISTWIGHQLKNNHALQAVAFAGPGVGIILSGVIAFAMDLGNMNAAVNWLCFGMIALLLAVFIYRYLPHQLVTPPMEKHLPMSGSVYRLLIGYSFCGLGYILPATFLSKLAIDHFHGSLLADFFWPLFGFAMIAGIGVLSMCRNIKRPQAVLALLFWMQGFGVLFCTFMPNTIGLILGTILIGVSFLTILQLTMRIAAELVPTHIRPLAALLTTGFSLFQFIGPMLSAASTHLWGSMVPALICSACAALVAGFLIFPIQYHHHST